MAYDEGAAHRIRQALEELQPPGFVERKMFGGIGFMVQGNMACGINGNRLIVRVGPERYEDALKGAGTVPFDITGRPMKGWVMIVPDGYESDGDLKNWVQKGVDFALTLPAK